METPHDPQQVYKWRFITVDTVEQDLVLEHRTALSAREASKKALADKLRKLEEEEKGCDSVFGLLLDDGGGEEDMDGTSANPSDPFFARENDLSSGSDEFPSNPFSREQNDLSSGSDEFGSVGGAASSRGGGAAAASSSAHPMGPAASSSSGQPVGPAASSSRSGHPMGPAASNGHPMAGLAASSSSAGHPMGPAASSSSDHPMGGPAASPSSGQPVGPAASSSGHPVGPWQRRAVVNPAVQTLVAMGFDQTQAEAVVAANEGGAIEELVEMLVHGGGGSLPLGRGGGGGAQGSGASAGNSVSAKNAEKVLQLTSMGFERGKVLELVKKFPTKSIADLVGKLLF